MTPLSDDDGDPEKTGTFDRALTFALDLLKQLKNREQFYVTLVQFSGVKEYSREYIPGRGGLANPGSHHYRIEVENTCLEQISRSVSVL